MVVFVDCALNNTDACDCFIKRLNRVCTLHLLYKDKVVGTGKRWRDHAEQKLYLCSPEYLGHLQGGGDHDESVLQSFPGSKLNIYEMSLNPFSLRRWIFMQWLSRTRYLSSRRRHQKTFVDFASSKWVSCMSSEQWGLDISCKRLTTVLLFSASVMTAGFRPPL